MNHKKVYDDLINNAKLRTIVPILDGDSERHHVIPKSLGGSNKKHNIVRLSPREHFIAHWLLWKIYKNKEMAFGFHTMTRKSGKHAHRYISSRGYAEARKARGTMQSIWIKNKWESPDYRNKMSNQSRKNWTDPEYRKKTSEAIKNNFVWNNADMITRLHSEGKTSRELGRMFNTSKTTIMRVVKNHGK